MPHYAALSKTIHRESGIVPADLSYALEQAAVPVVAEEVPHVVPTMPLAFLRASQGSEFELVALQSLEADTNVFVHTNGRWIGGYRPAWYRAHPFRLLPDESGTRKVVCVDEMSPAFEHRASQPAVRLFDDEGELTQRGKDTVAFLEKLDQAAKLTQALVNQLDKAGVIVPWQVSVRKPDGDRGLDVPGIYHIDETALRALDAPQLGQLTKSGALMMAYSQLLSEHRLKGLERLYKLRETSETSTQKSNIDELFGGEDEDLTFDFDS